MNSLSSEQRKKLELRTEFDDSFEIRLAQDEGQINAALSIAHDAYVAKGFMKPNRSGTRTTPFHFRKESFVMNATLNKEVVGTLTAICDSELGLPMDKIYDLSSFRKKNLRIVEISTFAIRKEYRRKEGIDVFWPLVRYVHRFLIDFLQADLLVCTVNPSAQDFYKTFLGYKSFENPLVEEYDFVGGAPAVGFYLELANFEDHLKKLYAPTHNAHSITEYFSRQKRRPHEKHPDCLQHWMLSAPEHFWLERPESNRLAVGFSLHAFCDSHGFKETPLITNISKEGLQLAFKQTAGLQSLGPTPRTPVSQMFSLRLKVENHWTPKLDFQVRWQNQKGLVGAQCLSLPARWESLWDSKAQGEAQNLRAA